MDTLLRFTGCLLGLATGDALGTTLEFKPRGSFTPISGIQGGGPFHLQPGQWTDDTSMALCLAASLLERRSFDPRDQMERYCRWMDEGYMSSTGRLFDIGTTTSQALGRYRQTGDPFSGSTDPQKAGNGSIMRLAPAVLFGFPQHPLAIHYAIESSRTTHAAPQCLDACRLMAEVILRALEGRDKRDCLMVEDEYATGPITALARGGYFTKSVEEIDGSGYVVESLEAALWCFWRTDSFEAAVLAAANLGNDADTTAAVCGQIAGAFYGEPSIPSAWLDVLYMRDEIREMAKGLFKKV